MKSLLKKATPFVFVFSSLAVAATLITKEEVNKKVAAIVAPFNNETTTMDISFTDLNVDAVRALDFGIAATVTKKGPENELALKLQNASYHFGDGSAPTATADLSLQLDLQKAFGQETINQFGTDLDQLAKDLASEYTKKYGEAAILDIAMEDLQKDAQGNVQSARLRVNATIDMTKLPANLKLEDVELKSVQAVLSASTGGVNGKIQAVINPAYKGFDANQPGLKEIIEKLLSDDKETYDSISQITTMLDHVATWLVNQKPEQPPQPQPQP